MMKTVRTVGLGAVFGLVSVGSWLACDSSNAPPGVAPAPSDAGGAKDSAAVDSGAGGSSGGDVDSGSGSGSSSGSGSGSGSSGGDVDGGGNAEAGTVSCSAYCAAVTATCTGANAQYSDGAPGMAECMNACMLLPLGTSADTSGNTVGCRTYHTQLAAADGGAVPHCWHAGPFGYGACGTTCEGFCALATGWCSPEGGFDGGAAPYASSSACLASCMGYAAVAGGDAGFVVDGGFNSPGSASGNTRDCREWHLGKALESTSNQQVHCNHVGATSPTCT
jgi:hypothetical protein